MLDAGTGKSSDNQKATADSRRATRSKESARPSFGDLTNAVLRVAKVASPAGAGSAALQFFSGAAKPDPTPSQAQQLRELEEQGPRFGAASNANSPDPFMRIDPDTGDVLSRGDSSGTRVETPAADEKREAARVAREAALGRGTAGRAKQLTEADYLALSPTQRAAVDFNTLLNDAVTKDRKLNEKGKYDKPTAEYENSVKQLFGEDRGSDIYAPETVALLKQLDLRDKAADLDDFLGMKVTVTDKDLKTFDTAANGTGLAGVDAGLAPGPDVRDTGRFELQKDLADSAARLRESLVKGGELLQSFRQLAKANRNPLLEGIGGVPNKGTERFDLVDDNMLDYFNEWTAAMANPANTEFMTEMREGLKAGWDGNPLTDQDVNKFYSFLDFKAKNGNVLADNPEALTATDLLEQLGRK